MLYSSSCDMACRDILTIYRRIFSENKNIYFHFMSNLHIDTTQVVEILPISSMSRTYLFYIVNITDADVSISSHDMNYVEPN